MIIDLHMHSHYSPDGRYSVKQLLNSFSAGDIAGLTDHETIGGWKEFEQAAKDRGIKPILGVEWFADKCHILSYFLDRAPDDFNEFMQKRRAKEKNCMRSLHKIFGERFPQLVAYNEALAMRAHPEKILGMPALFDAIAVVTGVDRIEAEDLVRNEKKKIPLADRPEPFYAQEIIEKIISWGAVPVLAHPYRNFGGRDGRQNKAEVEKKIRELFAFGIKGLDVYSWNSNQPELDHLIGLCNELKLAPVIGSDFHHENKGLKPGDLTALDKALIKRVCKWIENGAKKVR